MSDVFCRYARPLRLLEEEHPYFSLKLVYDGDTLKQAVLDGKRIV